MLKTGAGKGATAKLAYCPPRFSLIPRQLRLVRRQGALYMLAGVHPG